MVGIAHRLYNSSNIQAVHRYHPYANQPSSSMPTFPHRTPSRRTHALELHPLQREAALDTMELTDHLAAHTLGGGGPMIDDGDGGDAGDIPPPKVTITYLKSQLNSLTHRARKGEFEAYLGHEDSLRRMVHAVFNKKSVMLTGQSGLGKRTLVKMLAHRLAKGPVPPGCAKQYLMELDVKELKRTPGWLAEFKKRLDECFKLKSKVILSLSHLQELSFGMEEREALGYLKQKVREGLRIIGTADSSQDRPLMADLEQSLSFIRVKPSDRTEINDILDKRAVNAQKQAVTARLRAEANKVERRYDIRIEDEAIETAIECAVDGLLDSEVKSDKLYQQSALWLERAVAEILLRIQEHPERFRTTMEPIPQVDKLVIYEVYSMWEGTPLDEIIKASTGIQLKNPLQLDQRLKSQVVGQDAAVDAVANSILNMVSGLKDETTPIGSFLFLGSTGVGKTELAKAVARELFGSENDLIRIDMSEYQESHTVSRLIGSPPGYVGYDKGGQLTNAVHKKPYSVILLDEIEKAHPDVLKVFLQVFDDGRMTDGKGKTVDFRNCLFILTSNLKAAEIGKYSAQGKNPDEILSYIQGFLIKTLSPELYNRLDAVIPFNHISKEILDTVIPMMLNRLAKDIREKLDTSLSWTPEVVQYLTKHGYNQELGLRPLKRLVTKHIRTLISKGILGKEFARGEPMELYVEEEILKVRKAM